MEGVMRGTSGHPVGRFGALGLVLAFLIALPSPALAQVDLSEGVGDKVDEAVDQTTDAADDAVDTVEETVDENTGPEGGTVDQVTDAVGDTAGTAGNSVDETTDETTDTLSEATGGRLDDVINDGAGKVGGVVDSLLGKDGKRSPRKSNSETTLSDRTQVPSGGLDGFVNGLALTPGSTAAALIASSAANERSPEVAPSSALQRLIESVGDIAPQVAFPLALILLVAAFLVVQGRVDRSDPKLALAPVDIDQDYLSFS